MKSIVLGIAALISVAGCLPAMAHSAHKNCSIYVGSNVKMYGGVIEVPPGKWTLCAENGAHDIVISGVTFKGPSGQ